MLIPLPVLMLMSAFLGQPVFITIIPGEMPQYYTPAKKQPAKKSEADEYSTGCVSVVCRA